MKRRLLAVAFVLAAGLIVVGTEGQHSANAQVRRAARVVAAAATLDFAQLDQAITDYGLAVDDWEAANATTAQKQQAVTDLEAQLAAAQQELADAQTAEEAAAVAADTALDAVTTEHNSLRTP